jgi:hypothetical protein
MRQEARTGRWRGSPIPTNASRRPESGCEALDFSGQCHAVERHCCRHDLDASEALQLEEVIVARHDEIGLRCHSRSQHLNVCWIAQDGRRDSSRCNLSDERCVAVEEVRSPKPTSFKLCAEFLAVQNAMQFRE